MLDLILKTFFKKNNKNNKGITIIKENRENSLENKRNILLKKEKNISEYFIGVKSLIKFSCDFRRVQRVSPQFARRNF